MRAAARVASPFWIWRRAPLFAWWDEYISERLLAMRTVPSSATRNSAHLRKRRPRSRSAGAITRWRSLERSVYADLNRLRQSQPEGLRGAEVDDQLEADGLLHRE